MNASPKKLILRTAVLGDSRVFDTYYATPDYGDNVYGYHQTFPHILQRRLLNDDKNSYDCVHIPDHFRGRTVENNILRLALTDPDVVVLCDGIWETLISKKHILQYVENRLSNSGPLRDPRLPDQDVDNTLVTLYKAGELALSPNTYADRIARIVSWFARRRRNVIWLTTPIPPIDHLGGIHFAGNYEPFRGWHECLDVLNRTTVRHLENLPCHILDLHKLMTAHGGASCCLIDQWHFSAAFHEQIAQHLYDIIKDITPIPNDHISRKSMLPGGPHDIPLILVGEQQARTSFLSVHPNISPKAETTLEELQKSSHNQNEPTAFLCVSTNLTDDSFNALIRGLPSQQIALLPEDITNLQNPAVADRSSFGSFE